MTHQRSVSFAKTWMADSPQEQVLYQPGTLDTSNLRDNHLYNGGIIDFWVSVELQSPIAFSLLLGQTLVVSPLVLTDFRQAFNLLGRLPRNNSTLPWKFSSDSILSIQLSRPLVGNEWVAISGVADELGQELIAQSLGTKRWVLVYGANEADRFEFAPQAYPGWLFAELLVRADTEAAYDTLKFLGNGVLVDEWSGATPIKMLRFPITAGNHALQLTYAKDPEQSSGEDRVWVHSLRVISPESAWAADFSGGMPPYFQLSGDANWEVVSGVLQTPTMLNNQSATIDWNVSLLVQEGG